MKKLLLLILLFNLAIFGQRISPVGLKLIKHYEGFRGKAYLCPAHVWTIGYGSTQNVHPKMVITEYEAEKLLLKDLERFENYVVKLPSRRLRWNEFDALVSLTFNVGYRIDSYFLFAINNSKTAIVVHKIKQFVHGGSKVLPGLVQRRQSEAVLYQKAILIF